VIFLSAATDGGQEYHADEAEHCRPTPEAERGG
jgi:hypothetical protein